jgi:signal transduction histidine kinase
MAIRLFPFTKGTHIWHGVTFLIIVVTLGVAFWGLHQTVKNFEAVVHNEEISEQLMELFVAIKVAEDQQREYLLTRSPDYLEAYTTAVEHATHQMILLERLSTKESRLHGVFPRLSELILHRLELLQRTLDLYRTQGPQAAIDAIKSGEGMQWMKEIRQQMLELQEQDLVLNHRLHEKAHEMEVFTLVTMAVGVCLTFLASLGTLWKFSRDLQARQNLETRLLEEAKLAEVSRRLGDIGHDIKNMLTPVQMGMTLLEDELREHFESLSDAERERFQATRKLSTEIITMTRRGNRRIQERVKEIADAVKGSSGSLRLTACNVREIVENVLDALRFSADEQGVLLHTRNLETLPIIQADEQRLFTAIYNLINNAIPEVPSGGSVTITGALSQDGKGIHLSVADTGRGMPPEIVQSLFTPHVVSHKLGGTGLGTKIVKDVVAVHGGTVTVESRPGNGTTFHLFLPKDGPAAVS